jgi:hypothetical protein
MRFWERTRRRGGGKPPGGRCALRIAGTRSSGNAVTDRAGPSPGASGGDFQNPADSQRMRVGQSSPARPNGDRRLSLAAVAGRHAVRNRAIRPHIEGTLDG